MVIEAFELIKTSIHTLAGLTYLNPDKEHLIQSDTSKKGLGTVLVQEGQPVIYASITLMVIEQ